VRPGANAIDVGANHGYYTMLMADLAGADGRVAAVEPNPDICRLLRRTVAINGFSDRVVVLEMAAGDTDGQSLRLGLPAQESKNAYVFSPTGARPPEERSVAIRGDRLDTVLADWDRLDFVKIDVEGAEEAAVGGLFRLLERHLPMLVLEFNPARCSAPAALLDRLADLYGSMQHIDFDGEAHPTDRSALLDLNRREDWLLYFSSRPSGTP
jgi:FkbM family methyltransferase